MLSGTLNCTILVYVWADVSSSDPCDSEESVKDDRLSLPEPDDEQDLPVYLWRPGQTTDVIGQWEQHTRVSHTPVALTPTFAVCYSAPVGLRSIVIGLSVCLCVSVCL